MDKDFDCVEMKRQGQQVVHDRLKAMSRERQLEYWQKRFREMVERQRAMRERRASA